MPKTGGGDVEKLKTVELGGGMAMVLAGVEEENGVLTEDLEGKPAVLVDKPFERADSDFQAAPEDHAAGIKQRGRPRKEPTPGPNPSKPFPVPTPPFRQFKSDATNPHQSFKTCLNWWNKLPEWAKNHVEVYVYRDHPILLEPEKDFEGKPVDFKYSDKISGAEPLQDTHDLLNRYGCGSYHLIFNEVLAKGEKDPEKGRSMCTAWAVNLGGGDYRSNPPTDRRINDVASVDLNHPGNAAYVSYLRSIGMLPNQIDNLKKEAEMANVAAVQEERKFAEKLLDRVLLDNDKKQQQTVQAPGGPTIPIESHHAAVKVMADANDYAAQVRARVDAALPAGGAQQPQRDPFETAIVLMKLLKEEGGGGSAEIQSLRAELTSMRSDRLTEVEKILAKVLEKLDKPAAALDSVPNSLENLKKAKKALEELTGDRDDKDDNPLGAAANALAPKGMEKYMPMITQGLTLLSNWMMRPQMPPGYYPQQMYPQQQPGPYGYPQAQAQPNWQTPPQTQTAPGPSNVVQMPNPGFGTPMPQGPPQANPEPIVQLLTAIAYPLKRYLDSPDLTGSDFADWFDGGYPEGTYAQIAAFGPQEIIRALFTVPATAAIVSTYPQDKVQKFVEEFCNPTWPEGEGEEGEGDTESVNAANGTDKTKESTPV